MAHGTLLSDEDIKLLAARGTSVSHCPLSNFFLGDACFRSARVMMTHYCVIFIHYCVCGWRVLNISTMIWLCMSIHCSTLCLKLVL